MTFVVRDNLASLASIYGAREHAPSLRVKLGREPQPAKGDTVRVCDNAGNEVDAVVDGIEIRCLPLYSTLANPRLDGLQGQML